LHDPAFVVDDLPERIRAMALEAGSPAGVDALCRFLDHWLFFVNPPDHTRLRQTVARPFSAAAINELTSAIQGFTEETIHRARNTGRMDLVRELARPLPAFIAASLLGIPLAKAAELAEWSGQLFSIFVQPSPFAHYLRLNRCTQQFESYLAELWKTPPASGLMAHLSAARAAGTLTDDEALAFCMMLFSVGQDTTQHLIANGMLALFEHPEQMAALREHPDRMAGAVTELARYDTPVQMIVRRAARPVDLRDATIREGERVHLLLGSAHHDERAFDEPEQLNLTRPQARGLLFGSGLHLCLGAHLALMASGTVIRTILDASPTLRRTDERPQWIHSAHMRGLASLPCVWPATAEGA
jgi:pimeloyl-[acyl-carrier protein] synthase